MLARTEVWPRWSRKKKREEHDGPSRMLMAREAAAVKLISQSDRVRD
jgi:hypothetical protein